MACNKIIIAFVAIFAAVLLQKTSSLECFICDTPSNGTCGSQFNATTNKKDNCSVNLSGGLLPDTDKNFTNVCVKLVAKERTIRHCFQETKGLDICDIADSAYNTLDECFTCDVDGCNSSGSFVASFLLVWLIVLFKIIL